MEFLMDDWRGILKVQEKERHNVQPSPAFVEALSRAALFQLGIYSL
jgi:hypothetical protein